MWPKTQLFSEKYGNTLCDKVALKSRRPKPSLLVEGLGTTIMVEGVTCGIQNHSGWCMTLEASLYRTNNSNPS